ncbi:MAG: hypothetical protein E5V41_16895 [Mesorhizobium sp.]|nr:MAG: hypothetical protein E5V41_16895 [Mesorhizobium sp.]
MTCTASDGAADDGGTAELLTIMRSTPPRPSLAATFPTAGRGHWARESPLPVRITRATRRLANNGAMIPEGCTLPEMERVRANHRISREVIKEIMGTLWSFRLLGWLPSDTLYLTWSQVEAFVTAGTRRSDDTQDLIPEWFINRHAVDELKGLRAGVEV